MKKTIRLFDVFFSLTGLIIFSPFFILIAVFIKINSKGPIFFLQQRVGKNSKDFTLIKFRSMKINNVNARSLTVGRDERITSAGAFLRKYKIDELPQLWNVLKGEMSIAGPRPELRKYVNYYTQEQKNVLNVRPGLSDFASVAFRNENELLASANDPECFYIEKIMPIKIALNQRYIEKTSIRLYFLIIFKTLFSTDPKLPEKFTKTTL